MPVVLVEKYGSKTRASASSSMPTPVSRTSRVTSAVVDRRVDDERPLARHGVQGVFDDVRQARRDQRPVDQHRRQRRGDLVVDLDPAGEAGAVRVDDIGDELGEIDRREARGRR